MQNKNKTYNKKLTKFKKQVRMWQWLIGVTLLATFVIGNWGNGTQTAMDRLIEPVLAQETLKSQYNASGDTTRPTVQQVKDEIITQSVRFGVDTKLALDLAQCESMFNYKAKNKKSTARGVYQYLIGTWEATESAKQGLERNDYKANIREAMIDLANGEFDKWVDCFKKIK